jgi:UDP-GlcNAc3NAcA epimerase
MAPRIVSVIGSRPEIVQAAPLSLAYSTCVEEILVHTGQHYDPGMSDLQIADLRLPLPEFNLGVGSLPLEKGVEVAQRRIARVIENTKPDAVLVRGDTSATIAGARAAVAAGVPLLHVEAGLRSYRQDMPEEHNRIETDRLSWLLFCPDDRSKRTLEAEGVLGRIYVVGDVMADASRLFAPLARAAFPVPHKPRSYVIATIHRQANVEQPRLGRIVEGLDRIDEMVVFPVHPRTRARLQEDGLTLGSHVRLIEPLSYLELASLASQARVIVTDSGGLQKEAYWYGVPCVTVRPSTEWVDTVAIGANVLVDDDPAALAAAVANASLPPNRPVLYGDGHASERIAQVLAATIPSR